MVALIVGGFTAWKVRARRKAAALLPPAAAKPSGRHPLNRRKTPGNPRLTLR
jgi:hypothetical protein